ncbi:MAG: ribonuclease P protein component, partial [Chitinophagales bacterium]|nr:ribonuclease P protein component [Chitinophagales bacterium]
SSLSRSNIPPPKILIAVSTKNFKRAVDRNKVKRLIREAYRLNKQVLYDSLKGKNTHLIIGFIYTSKTIESFSLIQEKVILVMKKLAAQNATATKNID